MNKFNEMWSNPGNSEQATRLKPLPFIQNPVHLRLLGRDEIGSAPILSKTNPAPNNGTPRHYLSPPVSRLVARGGLATENRHSNRGPGDFGDDLLVRSRSPQLSGAHASSVRAGLFAKAGFEHPTVLRQYNLSGHGYRPLRQSAGRPIDLSASSVDRPQPHDPGRNFGRLFQEILGISSALAQAGPNTPNFAAQARKEFLKANPNWIAGTEYYVKNPFTRKLVKFVPDVLRPTERSEKGSLEFHAGELKAGRQSNRRRVILQILKYKWAEAGIYNRYGKRLGRVGTTTYFMHGNRKQLSQQSKSFRSMVKRLGHKFHALSGKPRATNAVGNMPLKKRTVKPVERANKAKESPRPSRSSRGGGGGGGALGIFKYKHIENGHYNPLLHLRFM